MECAAHTFLLRTWTNSDPNALYHRDLIVFLIFHRDAWSAQHGLSRTEAKRQYITTLIETMHQYASTTREARELVAELEFVWDQIKSNSVSSASSPGRNQNFIPPSQSTMPIPPGIEPPRAREVADSGDGGGDLRLLRPSVNDIDQESEDGPPLAPGLVDAQLEAYELRNRKWRKRIEQILNRMTAEIASLREQLQESRDRPPPGGGPPRTPHHRNRRRGGGGIWTWMFLFVVATARHLIIDAVIVGLWFWLWRRSDARLRDAVKWWMGFVRERIRRVGREVEGWGGGWGSTRGKGRGGGWGGEMGRGLRTR